MKHTFNLVSPSREYSTIRLVVSHNGEKFRKSAGVSIRTSLWNQKARTVDKMCKDKKVWEVIGPIHAKLVEKEVTAVRRRDVLAAISYALGLGDIPAGRPLFWPYFKDWSERDTPSRRFRELAYKRISAIMGTRDDWEDIDGDWYFRFLQKADALGYSPNYKSTLIAKLKTVMNEGMARGFHNSTEYKSFSTAYKTADTIALTQDEVDAIWSAKLSGVQARARDCFIVGVYCAGRFQDYSKLSEDNLVGGKLRYVQRKTGQTVIVPCSPRIKEIFARNGGAVPRISEQEVGREIKKICKDLGGSFNEKVEIRKTRGKRSIIERHPRHELVSCHTARRSGASILYKSGVPIRVCRFLTGHTTDSMFLSYVKIGKEEGAEILAKSDFFK
jgi:integrase